MECFLALIALLGLVFIVLGMLYYMRPDIAWRVRKWSMEFWGDIQVEQGPTWSCWSRVGAVTVIITGLAILGIAAGSYSDFQRSSATRSAYIAIYTEAAATRPARATDYKKSITILEAIFAPLMPTLRARAQAAPGKILTLFDSERKRYGLENSPVYFGICGHNNRFYVIVENWGSDRAKYQYGNAVSTTVPRTGCGSLQASIPPNGWGQISANAFDYELELAKTRSAATAARQAKPTLHFGP